MNIVPINSHHELHSIMRKRGWVDYGNQLVHPKYPDLQYTVYPFWGIIEQRRIKGLWWAGTGWSFGRMSITRRGEFKRENKV